MLWHNCQLSTIATLGNIGFGDRFLFANKFSQFGRIGVGWI
ncbi:hypothetical protein [Anabaena subtropica]|nr:hypothetical protein [Anabaena subtropica]